MIISIIVALAENNAIGKDNQLLFRLPDDMKRFKRLTTGHTIIMGKKTYFSLPKKPLPDRMNMVITDDPNDRFEGCTMAYSIDDAISKCNPGEAECFIIGGGTIYNQFFEKTDKLYLTKISRKVLDADIFFPKIDYTKWILTETEDHLSNDPPYEYMIYERKK